MFFIRGFWEFSEVDIKYEKVFTLFAKGNIFMININKHLNGKKSPFLVIAVQKDKCISFNLCLMFLLSVRASELDFFFFNFFYFQYRQLPTIG